MIYTKPRHEIKVLDTINEMKITSFFPTRKVLRIWSDRKKYVEDPIFPSYIFVYLRNLHDYYAGVKIDGIIRYIKFGNELARVNDSVITSMRILLKLDKDLEVYNDHFYPGQQLVIKQGPLTGLSCEVVQYNGKQRFLVRLNLLKRNLLVEIASDYLMVINSSNAC